MKSKKQKEEEVEFLKKELVEAQNLVVVKFQGLSVEKDTELRRKIREAGSKTIRFTSLENVGHNCWSAAYATPELYQWMLRQTISARQKQPLNTPAASR